VNVGLVLAGLCGQAAISNAKPKISKSLTWGLTWSRLSESNRWPIHQGAAALEGPRRSGSGQPRSDNPRGPPIAGTTY